MAERLDHSGERLDWLAIRKIVDQRMAKDFKSVEQVAQLALVAPVTVSRLRQGTPIKLANIYKIFRALGLEFNPNHYTAGVEVQSSRARPEYGGYSYEDFDLCLGAFIAYRRSLFTPKRLLRSIYTTNIDRDSGCIRFRENQKFMRKGVVQDNSQEGTLHASKYSSSVMHLVTSGTGLVRLITLLRPTRVQFPLLLRGAVLTQRDKGYLAPAASPIFLEKIQAYSDNFDYSIQIGPVESGDADFERANEILIGTEEEIFYYAR